MDSDTYFLIALLIFIGILIYIVLLKLKPELKKQIIGAGSGFFSKIVTRQYGKDHFSIKDEPELKVFFNTADRSKDFWFTSEGVYSMTRANEATQINKIMFQKLGKPLSELQITDATACIGGNTLAFGREFKHVTAVELNPQNYAALVHNIEAFGLNDKITAVNSDYTSVMSNLNQDVVFADPPWGGLDYRDSQNISLELSGIKIEDLVSKLHCAVFIKVPHNFAVTNYINKLLPRKTEIIKFKKFLLLYTLPRIPLTSD